MCFTGLISHKRETNPHTAAQLRNRRLHNCINRPSGSAHAGITGRIGKNGPTGIHGRLARIASLGDNLRSLPTNMLAPRQPCERHGV
jgi:hypothetical protein